MTSCAQCSKRVYAAEDVQCFGQHFHRPCFRCSNEDCLRSLDRMNACEHDGKPFCASCYRTKFGVQGVRGATANSRNTHLRSLISYGDDLTTPVTNSISYGPRHNVVTHAQLAIIPKAPPAKQPVKEQQDLPPKLAFEHLSYKPQEMRSTAKKEHIEPPSHAPPAVPASNPEDSIKAWHRQCFKCGSCERSLDQGSACESKGAVYCRGCYARDFGPKGYGRIAVAGP